MKAGALLRGWARAAFRYEPLRGWRIRWNDRRRPPHPVDVAYGIRTGGTIGSDVLYGSVAGAADRNYYVGSQAGVVRRALGLVRDREHTALVDLGCGKGRVLAIGTEFGFREIVGLELSAPLAAVAVANMAIVARRFPERTRARVVCCDAASLTLPDGPLAVFLFHPFGETTMQRVIARLEERLARSAYALTIAYYNPVCGALFDASSAFVRAHALSIPYDDDEPATAEHDSSAVVIWEDRRHAQTPLADALRPIVVVDAMHVRLGAAEEPDAAP